MISLENLLKIYDMNLYINKYLDINSFRNLLITSKTNYINYEINKIYFDKENIRKIFKHFNLSEFSLIKSLDKLSDKELFLINKQLNNIYNHFNKKKYCHISDFLNYLIERNYQTTILFETFVSLCKFKPNIIKNINELNRTDIDFETESDDMLFNSFLNMGAININSNSCITRFTLTTNDIQYILKYCNLKEFKIMLTWFRLPPAILSFLIKDLLFNQKILLHVDKKINKVIDYFLYNYCSFDFTNNSHLYFDSIVNEIISHNKISLFLYILEKKKEFGFNLNYQLLINKSLEYRNLQVLKIIIANIKEDNKQLENKIQISISPELIYKICSNGAFDLLQYVVMKMLGRMINMNKYISNLCDGISSFYINNNKKAEIRKHIYWLNDWLTDENKYFLKSHLTSILAT